MAFTCALTLERLRHLRPFYPYFLRYQKSNGKRERASMQIFTSKIILLYKSFLEGFFAYHEETRYKQVYTG